MADDKQHAYKLIDKLAPVQLTAVIGLLEAMLDPVSRALRNAPMDDEPETEDEREAVKESKSSLARHGSISNDDVMAELGFKESDFEMDHKHE